MYETGHFATLWKTIAVKLGLEPEFIGSDWRSGADAAAIEARLREDKGHAIKAVCVVHNETSTGATSRIDEVRKAIDAAKHPALLMVDTISSLASIDYRHDEWGVDVTVGGSQKGLMLPPGLGFNAVSQKALAASQDGQAAQILFRLGRDDCVQQGRLLPLHAGDQPAVRPGRGGRHAARGRARPRVRPARPARRGRAARGEGVGARDPVQGPEILLVGADGRRHARGAQCG